MLSCKWYVWHFTALHTIHQNNTIAHCRTWRWLCHALRLFIWEFSQGLGNLKNSKYYSIWSTRAHHTAEIEHFNTNVCQCSKIPAAGWFFGMTAPFGFREYFNKDLFPIARVPRLSLLMSVVIKAGSLSCFLFVGFRSELCGSHSLAPHEKSYFVDLPFFTGALTCQSWK